ncbi:MAG: hypothetical protein CL605_05475 [Altibacter sp.]|uniref:hypothetical protein n=1 Tax=Altibacter sp. TaxID=2024823 RepID=UPI000C923FB0|nr:hypothetical protein [Altibacter sp.]MAP54334.1 hypothetical protein [Altibacter sp.]|tara:strand:- start:6663 stop:7364 length:702 start_codon:yes stop_codon:yes gene_type:complete
MLTSNFRGDIEYLSEKLKNKEPFSIARFGDGEMAIINNNKLNLLHKGEFNFDGQKDLRKDLLDSFQHNQDNYFIGIACRCCVGDSKHQSMKEVTSVVEERLTWANIFVNSNYNYFRESVIPLFNNYKTTLISPGDASNLNFKVDDHYKIGPDAWINNKDVYPYLGSKLDQAIEHNLILLCAGPFANILCKKLYEKYPNHTIIDLGSVLNIDIGVGANRGYLRGAPTLSKTCIW